MSATTASCRKQYVVPALSAVLAFSVHVSGGTALASAPTTHSPPADGPPGAAKREATAYLNFGARIGNEGLEGYSDMILPLASSEQGIVFFNPRVSLAEEGQGDFSLGLALRRMVLPGLVAGGNLYTDVAETRHGNRLSRLGLGLELLSDWVDFRANWYDALGSPEMIGEYADVSRTVSSQTTASTRVTGRSVSSGTLRPGTETLTCSTPGGCSNGLPITLKQDGTAVLPGSYIRTGLYDYNMTTRYATTYTTRTTTTTITDWFERFEGAGDGWDAELGFRIPWPGPELRVFGGWYSFNDPFGPDMEGWKARAEFRPGPWLALEGGLYEDEKLTGSDWFVGARVEIPLSRDLTWADVRDGLFGGRARTLDERMRGETTARDALRGRESGWLENPARRQVESETVVSRRTEGFTRSDSWSDWESTPEKNPAVEVRAVTEDGKSVPAAALATVSATGTAQVVVKSGGKANTVTVKSENNSPTIAGALANSKQTVFIMDDRTYAETVTVGSGQILTSELHLEKLGGGSFMSSSGAPAIATSASSGPVVTMEAGSALHRVNVTNTATSAGSVGIKVTPGGTGTTSISRSTVTTSGASSHGVHVDGSGGGTFGDLRITDSAISAAGASSNGVHTWLDNKASMGNLTVENTDITATTTGVFTRANNSKLGDLSVTLSQGGSIAAGWGVETELSNGAEMGSLAVDLNGGAIDAINQGVYTSLAAGSSMNGNLSVNVGDGSITATNYSGVFTWANNSKLGDVNVTLSKGGSIAAGWGVDTELSNGAEIGSLAVDLNGGAINAINQGVYTSLAAGSSMNGNLSVNVGDGEINASIVGVWTNADSAKLGDVKVTLSKDGSINAGWGVYTNLSSSDPNIKAELGGLTVDLGGGNITATTTGVYTYGTGGAKLGDLSVKLGGGSINAGSYGVDTMLTNDATMGGLAVDLGGGSIKANDIGVYTRVTGLGQGVTNIDGNLNVNLGGGSISTTASGNDFTGGVYTALAWAQMNGDLSVTLGQGGVISAQGTDFNGEAANGVHTYLFAATMGGQSVNVGGGAIDAAGSGAHTGLYYGSQTGTMVVQGASGITAGSWKVERNCAGGLCGEATVDGVSYGTGDVSIP